MLHSKSKGIKKKKKMKKTQNKRSGKKHNKILKDNENYMSFVIYVY